MRWPTLAKIALCAAVVSVALCRHRSILDDALVNDAELARERNPPLLDARVDEFRCDALPLDQAFSQFTSATHQQVRVQWDALAAAGVQASAPITVRATSVRASKLLKAMCSSVNGACLSYSIRDGCVFVSTPDAIGRDVTLRVYSVQDLLGRARTRYRVAAPGLWFVKFVEETVDPNSGCDNGGRYAVARCAGGYLFVFATAENHWHLHVLLRQLRETDGFLELAPL
jgi:hypothetical protein